MKILVTHQTPDLDAVTSVWLLKRFHAQVYADAKVVFVPAGQTISPEQMAELGVQEEDVTPVDTGLGEFDHHQKERGQLRICAASLVYDWLCEKHPELRSDWALQQIVDQAIDEDHFGSYFWPEPDHPRYVFRLSEILHGLEMTQLHDDTSQLQFAMHALDGVYAQLNDRQKAQEEVKEGQTFQTRWGKALACLTSNQGVLKVAQIQGFKVVVQKDPRTGHIRIKAAPLPEIDLTPAAELIMKKDAVGTWFFHASTRMLLNNSTKNTQHVPSPLSLEEVIEILSSV